MTTTTTSDAPPPLIQPSSPSSASSSDADLPASPPLLPADQPVPSVIIQSASPPISSPASLSPAPNDLPASGRKPHSPVRPIERNKRRDTVHDLSAFKLEQGRGTSSLDEGARKSTLTAPTKSSTTTTRPSRHPRRASTGGAMVGAAARKSIAMMEPSQPAKSSIEAKVVIIGQAGVGKTSLVHRYTSGSFGRHEATIGAAFQTKKIVLPNGARVNLALWDTAGQERFRSTAPIFYREAHAAVVVYDITREQSFLDVKSWLDELRINLNQNFVLHVVGAKLDLANGQREVDLDRARRQVRAWLCEPPGPTPNVLLTSHNTLSPQSTMNTTLEAAAAAAEEPKARQSMSFGFGSFGQRSRREDSVRTLTPTTTKEPGMPFSVSEVSALTNTGIDQLFFQVSMKLSERREAIERDAERKARESIMLTTASTSSATRNEAPAGTWGCC